MKFLFVIAASLAVSDAAAVLPRAPAPTVPPKLARQNGGGAPADYTQTLSNGAVIGVSAGVTTTIQAGASMTLQMDPSASANAGTFNGDELFTSISASLEAACPTPTGGQTISACSSVAPVSSVIYVAYNAQEPKDDGLLAIDVPIVSYSDANVRQGLITAIAQAVRNSANMASNHHQQKYYTHGSSYWPGTNGPYFNMVNVGSLIEATYTDQDAATGGIVLLQNMLVSLAFEAFDGGEFACSDVALGADVASLLALIPGLEWLAFAGPAMSAVCDGIDHSGGP